MLRTEPEKNRKSNGETKKLEVDDSKPVGERIHPGTHVRMHAQTGGRTRRKQNVTGAADRMCEGA